MNYVIPPDLQRMLDASAESMALFDKDYKPFNQYAIVRLDLQMDPPKMASQACHAIQMSMRAARRIDPEVEDRFCGSGNGTKLMMGARNLFQLEQGYRECIAAGIPCHLVIDRGHVYAPHFDGKPIFTALGIGPVLKEDVAKILRRYSMLKQSDFSF